MNEPWTTPSMVYVETGAKPGSPEYSCPMVPYTAIEVPGVCGCV